MIPIDNKAKHAPSPTALKWQKATQFEQLSKGRAILS